MGSRAIRPGFIVTAALWAVTIGYGVALFLLDYESKNPPAERGPLAARGFYWNTGKSQKQPNVYFFEDDDRSVCELHNEPLNPVTVPVFFDLCMQLPIADV